MSRARELSRLGNPNIISADANYNVGFGTLTPRAKGDFVGVVSATSFYGDGSTLSNIASAGIGTAVSDNKTSPLNHLYYTNQTLDVGVTTTVDVPASAALGYSQAAEIAVGNGADFIIADGDELIIDILGISTSGSPPLSGSGGRVRADNFTNRAATGAPDAPQGFKITATTESTNSITGALIVSGGVGIAKSLHVGGNVSVGGTLTYEDVTNQDVLGIATYRSGVKFGVAGVGGTITATGNATFAGIVTASMPGSNISSGIVTSARLGTGAASGKYLDGNGVFVTIASGMSEIDMWVQSTDGGTSGDFANDVLLSGDDARVPDGARAASGFTKVGDGMTETAGIFTFPSTGTWEIYVRVGLEGSAAGAGNLKNWLSTNSGGAWTEINRGSFSAPGRIEENSYTNVSIMTITDASTARFKATIWNAHGHNGLQGGSAPYRTYIIFKKLA